MTKIKKNCPKPQIHKGAAQDLVRWKARVRDTPMQIPIGRDSELAISTVLSVKEDLNNRSLMPKEVPCNGTQPTSAGGQEHWYTEKQKGAEHFFRKQGIRVLGLLEKNLTLEAFQKLQWLRFKHMQLEHNLNGMPKRRKLII